MVAHLVDRMRALAARWARDGDQAAVFAEAYGTMTANVGGAIRRGDFADGVWVSRLRDRFAEYYFEAVDAWESGGGCAPAWEVAMACRRRTDLHPMQHLFLGINAHINRDLPLTLVDVLDDWRTLDDATRRIRRADHDAVNDVIARTIDAVQAEVVGTRAPEMNVLDGMLGGVDEWLFGRLIARWRGEVWDDATEILEGGDVAAITRRIEARARRYADLIEF